MSTSSKTLAPGVIAPAVQPSRWRRRAKGLALPVLIILLLEAVVRLGWIAAYQMPAPSEVAQTLLHLADGALWKHIGASLSREKNLVEFEPCA